MRKCRTLKEKEILEQKIANPVFTISFVDDIRGNWLISGDFYYVLPSTLREKADSLKGKSVKIFFFKAKGKRIAVDIEAYDL